MTKHNHGEAERRLFRSFNALRDSTDTAPREYARKDPNAPPPTDLGFYIPTGNRKLDAILANSKVPIRYGGSDAAIVAPYADRNNLSPFGSTWMLQPMPEQFTSEDMRRATLAHELVHWTREDGRTPRIAVGMTLFERMAGIMPPGYIEEELVAEIGAGLLLEAVGADPDWDERARYLLEVTMDFSGPQEAEQAFRRALPKAEAAVDYLLQFAEEG